MTRTRNLIAAALAPAVFALSVFAAPAFAGTSSAQDADDTEGVLDIASAKIVTKSGTAKITIKTYESFKASDLGANGSIGVGMIFGTKKARGLSMTNKGAGRICDVTTGSDPKPSNCSKVKVNQKGNSVAFTFATKLIRPKGVKAKSFEWVASTSLPTGSGGCTTDPFCFDLFDAPVKHKI